MFFDGYGDHRDLHVLTLSFPTRRSSDLGFAMKGVIIGGGCATGRGLAEYFVPSGPWCGLAAMLLATLIWSVVAALTFALARKMRAYDYRSFFEGLLGPAWIAFEVAYLDRKSGV